MNPSTQNNVYASDGSYRVTIVSDEAPYAPPEFQPIPKLTNVPISISASGASVVVPVPCMIYRIFLLTSAATNLTFRDSTMSLSGALPMQATTAVVLDTPVDTEPWFNCLVSFVINSSASVTIGGSVYVLFA